MPLSASAASESQISLFRSVLYPCSALESARCSYLRPEHLIRPRRGQTYWCLIRPRL